MFTETAVQVSTDSCNLVIYRVHSVGKSHGVFRQTIHAIETETCISGVAIWIEPIGVLRVVEANCQMVVLRNVPVYTGKNLVIAFICGEAGKRTSVITISRCHEILYILHIADGSTRDKFVRLCHAISRSSPAIYYGRNLAVFAVDEEEKFVLDNRATKRHAVSSVAHLSRVGKCHVINTVSMHVFVVVIDVGRAAESICTRLCYGVNTTTYKV